MPAKEDLFDFSRFELNAILRGAQLTLVGAQRALQNPGLWTTQHYRQAAIAVACGIAIRVLIEIPIITVKLGIWFLSWFVSLDTVTWDDAIEDGLRFLQEYVLQLPLFLMTLMRHITPAMDDLFMQSLQWVDYTYAQKHAHDGAAAAGDTAANDAAAALIDPRNRYYENLKEYDAFARSALAAAPKDGDRPSDGSGRGGAVRFLARFGRKSGMSLAVFALSYVPWIGRLVLPATSFLTFRRSVGLGPAVLIFGAGLLLPRRYLVVFLQTYYGQRSLMRELLSPYFARVHFAAPQRRAWFGSREGLLFGFGAGFFVLLRVPLVGVLIYGIAEASTAYLITKITDPAPGTAARRAIAHSGTASSSVDMTANADATDAAVVARYAASQQEWHNKKAFLELALDNLDALQEQQKHRREAEAATAAAAVASEKKAH